ncbi:hypothetical protein SCHPADRAFT_242821 [Schizopora paradoxa]|uniref:Uncharacterized protein n=1 Tax=Schizopora paradoxa TaxID=27342 RepID=A0A0H2RWG5_9AGAM|nr:hypothetical protein SCHPADRAFT_242821 [Schizopora paradoxa]
MSALSNPPTSRLCHAFDRDAVPSVRIFFQDEDRLLFERIRHRLRRSVTSHNQGGPAPTSVPAFHALRPEEIEEAPERFVCETPSIYKKALSKGCRHSNERNTGFFGQIAAVTAHSGQSLSTATASESLQVEMHLVLLLVRDPTPRSGPPATAATGAPGQPGCPSTTMTIFSTIQAVYYDQNQRHYTAHSFILNQENS